MVSAPTEALMRSTVLTLFLLLLDSPEGSAQDLLTQTLLARLYVSEAEGAGFDADHRAIFHVLEVRQGVLTRALGRSVSLTETIHRYGRYRFLRPRSARQRWVSQLSSGPLFDAMLARAAEHLRSRPSNPCPGAVHWGGARGVDDPAPGSRLRRVRCAEPTVNRFWR